MSVHDASFWQPYLPVLRREFADLTMDILIAGGNAGAGALPAASLIFDWDVFNENALSWLDMYLGSTHVAHITQEGAYSWAQSLNESTRRGVVREIDRWVRSGAELPELERRLESFFSQPRAHRVAVTEVTRIYASGNVMAWQASGVVTGKRWQTAVDERVCPVCAKLHNTFVELDRGWEFTPAALAADPALARAIRAPLTVVVPPAHVMCLLPGTQVVSPGKIRYATKAFYEGRVVEIRTQGGRVLTVTENHPILSGRGWVPAKVLTEADYVFSSDETERIAASVCPDDEHVPTVIEDIFCAFKETPGMVTTTVPVSAEHFHSDGRFMNGYIEIVTADGLLNGDIVSGAADPVGESSFRGRGFALGLFSSPGGRGRPFKRDCTPPHSEVGGGYLPFSGIRAHTLPLERFGFGLSARGDAVPSEVAAESETADPQLVGQDILGFPPQVALDPRCEVIDNDGLMATPVTVDTGSLQVAGNGLGADTVLAREFCNRFATQITVDNVIEIREFDFSGHVYNLQVDPYGLYFANEIIAHNCRCWLQPVVFEALSDEEREAGAFQPAA